MASWLEELDEDRIECAVCDLNVIIAFLARRDFEELRPAALKCHCGAESVEQIILLGGSTSPHVAELAAGALSSGLASRILLVGGAGHSTGNLRRNIAVHPRYRNVPTEGRAEADMLRDILTDFLAVSADLITVENESTNCGNNATFALERAACAGGVPRTAIVIQDPIMQRRSVESFKHEWREHSTSFHSFAPFIPLLRADGLAVRFQEEAHAGYYELGAFLHLVMGEVPRLRDDSEGYGPRGKAYIGHVDIPEEVEAAFRRSLELFTSLVREPWAG